MSKRSRAGVIEAEDSTRIVFSLSEYGLPDLVSEAGVMTCSLGMIANNA